MQFNPTALDAKQRHLDSILAQPDLLARTVRTLVGDVPYEIVALRRPWEPGGGASLFRVTTNGAAYFLKVKHVSVTIESKLEGEAAFSPVPSLRNEHEMLRRLAGRAWVPAVHGYVEAEEHCFLLLEELTSFEAGTVELGAGAVVEAYEAIVAAVRALYADGIVHTDLHEKNLMFRGTTPVLVDFEEARVLRQAEPFEACLDVVGKSAMGDVGEMPTADGIPGGLTCLTRLRNVFTLLVTARLEPLIRSCNFDSSCPFLATLDHGKDERIYQSIQVPGLQLAGQRPLDDPRIPVIAKVGRRLFDAPYTHLDIGSNLGRFNLEMAQQPGVRRSIGVEAYDKYVELSRVLAFLSDVPNAIYHCAVGGDDSLHALLGGERVDLVTIYSVYHHIRNKRAFLADLAALAPRAVLLEMASQPECYESRSWQTAAGEIAAALGLPHSKVIGQSADYQRPIVLLSREAIADDLLADRPAAPASRPQPQVPLPTAPRSGPRVSVVLPVYNHLKFLPQAIGSLLTQTFTDFELIIVNDGSTDGTREYLDGLQDPRIVVVHQENRRLPGALNAGFARARGELFTWTSADNVTAPAFLEALVAALDAHPDCGFAYSAFAWIDDADRITGIHRDQRVSPRTLLTQNPGIAAFLYRRTLQERAGAYDVALDGAEDWDMWVRLVELAPPVYVPEILYCYRLHGDSMTATVPDKVAAASRQVVLKTLARCHDRLDLEVLYPALTQCADRAGAEFVAFLDCGTMLLRSPWAPPELALPFLEQACAMRSDVVAVAHLALAHGRAGRFTDVERALPALQGAAHPEVRRLAEQMAAATQQRQRDAFFRLPAFVLGRDGVELFEREASMLRVHAFTDQSAGEAAPVQAVTVPAPAPAPITPAPAAPAVSVAAPIPSPQPNRPLVSVIVPTMNRPDLLRASLRSILAQTFRDFEIVVVNDAGPDVHHVLAEVDTEQRITYVRHGVNRGLAAARNTGIGASRGQIITYLDDDDLFYPEHLEIVVAELAKGDVPAVYTDALRVTQVKAGERYVTRLRELPYSRDFNRDELLVSNRFPVLCVAHTRACFDEVGGFDESLRAHEDWDLWLRISARHPFRHVRNVTCEFSYRLDGTSMTSSTQPEYLRTAEVIYQKTGADAAGKPAVLRAREQWIGGLRGSVAPTPTPLARSTPPTPPASAADSIFDASIVIPVWNRVDLTEQCLAKLAEVTDGVTFEVILVDNGSTDKTPELFAALGGDVRVLRNEENLGFAVACNQGARAARGRHVVFLNNDTIPLPGWLRAMVTELDTSADAGVVGSKLLYPDDTIQHAGVAFARDIPVPFHVFHRAPADLPAVNRRRELNCVTGACLAVRRELFLQLDGFDEGFRNGYEDVDFCLRVRKAGWKVVYQPQSVLYHLESQTPGRKDSDQANGRRLLERWRSSWWWIGDEDVIALSEGYAAVRMSHGTRELHAFKLLADAQDRVRWQAVDRAQRALQAGDLNALRAALADPEAWPEDVPVLRYAAALARLVDSGRPLAEASMP